MDGTCEIIDDYEHLDNELDYIFENVLSENIKKNINECDESKELYDLFNTLLLNKCSCKGCFQKCPHGTNYLFNKEFKELVRKNNQQDLIYECSNICKCEKNCCNNRLVQYGPRKFLKIVDSKVFGSKGLITLQDIPKGAFICEYAGELVTTKEAKCIIRRNEANYSMNYVLFLKESCISQEKNATNNGKPFLTIVNPTKKGNIGRYLNHSCDPNCQTASVRIDSPIPKIAIFSRRYIKAGEELCFDYNDGENRKTISGKIPCLCASKNCFKFMPNMEL